MTFFSQKNNLLLALVFPSCQNFIVEQPKNLEDLDKLIQQKQQGTKYSSRLLITFIVLVIVLNIAVILFVYIFKPVKPEKFLENPQDLINILLAILIFALVYIGSGVFLLTSKLLSEKDKKTLRIFLFFLTPLLGWGVQDGDFPADGRQRFIFLTILITLGIEAIVLFLWWMFYLN